eukprot:3931949-Pleurochrysis_carterae.AAC.1
MPPRPVSVVTITCASELATRRATFARAAAIVGAARPGDVYLLCAATALTYDQPLPPGGYAHALRGLARAPLLRDWAR